jgi:alanine racemase
MDQLVVDLGAGGAADAEAGDEVVLLSAGDAGEPTAQDWADAGGTVVYEVVTRLGGRLTRTFRGADA